MNPVARKLRPPFFFAFPASKSTITLGLFSAVRYAGCAISLVKKRMDARLRRYLKVISSVSIAALIASQGSTLRAEITAEDVNASIRSGVSFLKNRQRTDGSWNRYANQPGGVTALCTLALINSGVKPDDPSVQRAMNYLRRIGPTQRMVYSTSLITMAFCAAEPKRDAPLIQENVRWLQRAQAINGGWDYGIGSSGRTDNSNSQYALLALHEAQRVGIEVDQQVWGRAKNYWIEAQDEKTGAFGYQQRRDELTGSMTCAGISSLIIAIENFRETEREVDGDRVDCCVPVDDGMDRVERAIDWMGRKFAVEYNPGPPDSFSSYYLLYYLYGMERAGRLSGRRFFGDRDWYREGAEFLVDLQNSLTGAWTGTSAGAESNPDIATALSLLFLAKGKRPVVVAKYKYGSDRNWDRHPKGIHFLTRATERQWDQDLNWQTVESESASPNDLLETPVLFISGKEDLRLSRAQKDALLEYVNQGGFIFAEACAGDECGDAEFDQGFRELIAELFPDSPLQILAPDHPIWFAQMKLVPDPDRPLYGVQACCRTSIVYCPSNLSCYWKLDQPNRRARYSDAVKERIDNCLAVGVNVLSYATNRELQEKLDRPQIVESDLDGERSRDAIVIPKLAHSGGADDAPGAWPNMLKVIENQLELRIGIERQLVSPQDTRIFDYPILFMHGRFGFEFTDEQRQALAEYLKRGGFIFCDSVCASPEFTEAFRNEMNQLVSGVELTRLAPDHPLLSNTYRGFDLSRVSLRSPRRGADQAASVQVTRTPPVLEGLVIDGRLAVVFSPFDISCAMENSVSVECKGYIKEDAAKIGINVVLFALQQ